MFNLRITRFNTIIKLLRLTQFTKLLSPSFISKHIIIWINRKNYLALIRYLFNSLRDFIETILSLKLDLHGYVYSALNLETRVNQHLKIMHYVVDFIENDHHICMWNLLQLQKYLSPLCFISKVSCDASDSNTNIRPKIHLK